MSNYPPTNHSGYPYSAPPPPNQPYPYSAPPPGAQPPNQSAPYAPVPTPYSAPAGGYPTAPPTYGSPFAAPVPSAFPPGTDPSVIANFQMVDRDRSGFIDDLELKQALSNYHPDFGLRTVHLLMYRFTNSNVRKIGPNEFTQVFYCLQRWKEVFERFDKDRSGKIEAVELKEALHNLGFIVSPIVLDLLVSKFDKNGGASKAIEYDNFIECCITVEGLTEKFKEKDTALLGSATFNYESFMLTVLPFIIA